MKEQIHNTVTILQSIFDCGEEPSPALGIDLDGTIDESPDFFSIITHLWQGKIYIITYRNDLDSTQNDLLKYNIKYNEIILVNSFAEKSEHIINNNIKFYFDDMDEVIQHIPDHVKVFKVRNGGNFNYHKKKWLYSKRTGEEI